jgi:hypothetical protein
VCDQALEKAGGPISFKYQGQEVKVCSEEHRAQFHKESSQYIAKIKEVKVHNFAWLVPGRLFLNWPSIFSLARWTRFGFEQSRWS